MMSLHILRYCAGASYTDIILVLVREKKESGYYRPGFFTNQAASVLIHSLLSMACSTRARPLSQSSQHNANIAVSLPIVPGRGSPSLSPPPLLALAFDAGRILSQRRIASNLNPIFCAISMLFVFSLFVCHCTRRSPRPCGGRSRAYMRSKPTAFVVTCVCRNGGRVTMKAISVDKCAGEAFKYPMTPAKSVDVGLEEESVRVLSITA